MKRCLKCGTSDGITKDHVASRVMIRQRLSRDEYQRFSTESRDINIQPLCAECNGEKGSDSIDYRPIEDRVALLILLDKWGLDIEVKVGTAHDSAQPSVRWCKLHQAGGHRTDDCYLWHRPEKIGEMLKQRRQDALLVEQHLSAQRTLD